MHIDHGTDQSHPVAGQSSTVGPSLTEERFRGGLLGVQQLDESTQERIASLNVERQQNKRTLDGDTGHADDYEDVQLIEEVGNVEMRLRRITEKVQVVRDRRCAVVEDDIERERERDGRAEETVEAAVVW